jgi:DNA-binding CsgD family transcriptional regulator
MLLKSFTGALIRYTILFLIMSTKKIAHKFYPLQHQEFLQLNQILTQSELSVYLWLKTNDPFGGKLIEADTQRIAQDLGISRRTVQRALARLQEKDLIELVIIAVLRVMEYRIFPVSRFPLTKHNRGVPH